MSHPARPKAKRPQKPSQPEKTPEKEMIPIAETSQPDLPPPTAPIPPSVPPETPAAPPTTPGTPVAAPDFQYLVEVTPLDRSNKMLIFAASILMGIITVASFSFSAWFRSSPRFHAVAAPSPTSAERTTEPTVTPLPHLQRSSISIEVLNGSGVAGTAKKAADKLADLGYQIVKIANAPNGTYPLTEVAVAPKQRTITETLLNDLATLSYAATASADLTDSTAAARVIIGKK